MGTQRYAELATRVWRVPPRCGPTRVVAVDGPAGSGKTTFAARLARALGDAPVVHMDDLYPGWDGLAAAVPLLVGGVLAPRAAGRPGRYRRWDWDRSAWAEWVPVPDGPVLVVEGCGSGSREVAPFLAMLVWVEAPAAVRRARGLARDGEVFRPHWQRWADQEARLFAAEQTRGRADLVVDGAPGVPHDPAEELVAAG